MEACFKLLQVLLIVSRIFEIHSGVKIVSGVEIDVINSNGDLAYFDEYFSFDSIKSVGEKLCNAVDVVIASYHDIYGENSFTKNKNMLLNIIENPFVDIIGHCDRINGYFDLERVMTAAKIENKIIEFNFNSLNN